MEATALACAQSTGTRCHEVQCSVGCLPALGRDETATVDGQPAHPGLADGHLCILQTCCLMEALQHLRPALSHVRAEILTEMLQQPPEEMEMLDCSAAEMQAGLVWCRIGARGCRCCKCSEGTFEN